MAPVKTDTGHGALYDLFPEHAQAIHGGARFDEGFNLQSKGTSKGRLFDEFRPSTEPDNGDHGQLWDEWGWKDMPDLHGGLLFDDGFAIRSSHEMSRGPLFDLFEPSTQVRFIYEGKDSEGIVDRVEGDDVFVRQRGSANVIPVGLSQFLAYRSPSLDNTATVASPSNAEAPSAWSSDAHGGPRTGPPAYGQPIEPTPQGQAVDARSGVPEGTMSIVDHLKTMLDPNDVQKHVNLPSDRVICRDCKGHGVRDAVDALTGETEQRKCRTCQGRGHNHVNFERARDSGEKHVDYDGGEILRAAKSAFGLNDVRKEHIGFAEMVKKLEGQGHSTEKAKAIAASIGRKKYGAKGMEVKAEAAKIQKLPSELLKSYSMWGSVTNVAKEVTVAEAAIQAEENAAPFSGMKGAGSYCPECRVKVKPTEDGRCPTCQMALKAHEGHRRVAREKGDGNGSSEDSSGKGVSEKISVLDDLRKAFGAPADPSSRGQTVTLTGRPEQKDSNKGQAKSDPSGPEVPERAHAESDHHEDKSKPKACPHCGMIFQQLDEKTREGAPSDVAPDIAHKCLEGMLDIFKQRRELIAA